MTGDKAKGGRKQEATNDCFEIDRVTIDSRTLTSLLSWNKEFSNRQKHHGRNGIVLQGDQLWPPPFRMPVVDCGFLL